MPLYNSAKLEIANGTIDLSSDTFYVMLLTGYAPDVDAHNRRDDVTGDEISGTGYTAGGAQITTIAVNQDNTNDRMTMTGDDVEWPTSTLSATHAVIYKLTGSGAASDNLLGYIAFGETKTSTAGLFKIAWAGGIVLTIT